MENEAAEPQPVEGIEAEPVDQVISEAPVPEPAPVAEETTPPAQRRFKSALLSDIDEPAAVDANARFKSTILADLSAVRLPDDGPTFPIHPRWPIAPSPKATSLTRFRKPNAASPRLTDHQRRGPYTPMWDFRLRSK